MTGLLGSAPARRSTARSVAVAVAALGLGLSSTASATSAPSAPGGQERHRGPSIHSSDGVVGPLAEPMPAARLAPVVVSKEKGYRVAPGLTFRRWDQRDARGSIRAYLLTANLRKPGLSLQYAGPEQVAARDELTDMLKPDKAVAGVNGDFFDISDTAAPLGVGIDGSAVLHGPAQGWMKSFFLPSKGMAQTGDLPVEASVPKLPDLGITNFNSPRVLLDGIGVYTKEWGLAPGYSVTDGAKNKDVRQVVIQDGVVVSNTIPVSSGVEIEGRILIGRGQGAVRLNRQLPVGTKAHLKISTVSDAQLAIGGSAILLHEGKIQTDDDGELHPRTAVGVDTDTGRILLLVVDGRQDFSRGYTLLELARLMKKLGAEEALNLDGGGSSTMITKRPSGRTRIANSPSDGHERQVANGLELVYDAP
jgi:hypothetical protein